MVVARLMAQTTSGCGTGGGGCGAIMGISDMKPTRSSDVIVYVIDSSASLAAAAAAAAALRQKKITRNWPCSRSYYHSFTIVLWYDVSVCLSVRLSVTEVHRRITANLGFKFRSKFTAHFGRGACGCEWRDHLALC